jgi:hypothetical protein
VIVVHHPGIARGGIFLFERRGDCRYGRRALVRSIRVRAVGWVVWPRDGLRPRYSRDRGEAVGARDTIVNTQVRPLDRCGMLHPRSVGHEA